MTGLGVAILTYSVKPRGGVVHALNLAEALDRRAEPVHLVALGDPSAGFFREVDVGHTLVAPPEPAETLEERVFDSVDALAAGLAQNDATRFDIVHAQDCIAARAALQFRGDRRSPIVVRTVHHVDEFSTPVLVECQRRSIVEPDHVLVLSDHWRRKLRADFSVDASIVPTGVDAARFARPPSFDPDALRARIGANGRFLWLTVGGIEPRKGSLELMEAFAKVVRARPSACVLAVVGGHAFQDHAPYRERALARAAALGVTEGRDLALLGTVDDAELPSWYHAADAFVFPSVVEGWGIAVLEALAARLPVVTSDIPVFREYLVAGRDAVLVPPHDPAALADAMRTVSADARLRRRLAEAGPGIAARHTWDGSAAAHAAFYRRVARRAVGGL